MRGRGRGRTQRGQRLPCPGWSASPDGRAAHGGLGGLGGDGLGLAAQIGAERRRRRRRTRRLRDDGDAVDLIDTQMKTCHGSSSTGECEEEFGCGCEWVNAQPKWCEAPKFPWWNEPDSWLHRTRGCTGPTALRALVHTVTCLTSSRARGPWSVATHLLRAGRLLSVDPFPHFQFNRRRRQLSTILCISRLLRLVRSGFHPCCVCQPSPIQSNPFQTR